MSAYERARAILTENREKLDNVSSALLERETLNGDEFVALMEGRILEPKPLDTKPLRPPEKAERPEPGTGIRLPGRNEVPSKA